MTLTQSLSGASCSYVPIPKDCFLTNLTSQEGGVFLLVSFLSLLQFVHWKSSIFPLIRGKLVVGNCFIALCPFHDILFLWFSNNYFDLEFIWRTMNSYVPQAPLPLAKLILISVCSRPGNCLIKNCLFFHLKVCVRQLFLTFERWYRRAQNSGLVRFLFLLPAT